MKSLREKKKWVSDFTKAKASAEDLEVFFEFYKAGDISADELDEQFDKTLAQVEHLEFKNMLSDEGDSLSAVLQITAGAGGTESCDWAAMLMRMYMMWSQKAGFKIKELNYQEGDVDDLGERKSSRG